MTRKVHPGHLFRQTDTIQKLFKINSRLFAHVFRQMNQVLHRHIPATDFIQDKPRTCHTLFLGNDGDEFFCVAPRRHTGNT